MGYEYERLALLLNKREQVFLKLAPGLLIDRRKRLVHQEDLRIDRQRSSQAHPLTHTARQFVRKTVFESAQPHILNILLRDAFPLRLGDAAQLQTKSNIADDTCPGQQRKILKDEGTVGTRSRHGLAVHFDLTGSRRQETGNDLQQRGFATSRRTQDGRELAARKVQRQILQGLDIAVVLRDIAGRYGIFHVVLVVSHKCGPSLRHSQGGVL